MEGLKNISRNQICEDILAKFDMFPSTALGYRQDLSNTVPRPSYSKRRPRPISEISAIISRRHEAYRQEYDIYKRQLNIRPPDMIKEDNRAELYSQRERPLSEFAVPNEWKRKTWDVTEISQRPAPSDDKLNYRRPKPQYEKSERDGEDIWLRRKKLLKEQVSSDSFVDSISNTGSLTQSLFLPITEDTFSVSSGRKIRSKDRKSKKRKNCVAGPETPVLDSSIVTSAELSAPGWGSRTLDKRFLEQAARESLDLDVVCNTVFLGFNLFDCLIYS
jgi:hypothetical protein